MSLNNHRNNDFNQVSSARGNQGAVGLSFLSQQLNWFSSPSGAGSPGCNPAGGRAHIFLCKPNIATASQTLAKRWGMYSGKSNLLVAMLSSLRLPARHRIYKIQPEQELWKWMSEEDGQLVNHLCGALMEQEYIEAEIYLNGMKACDPC